VTDFNAAGVDMIALVGFSNIANDSGHLSSVDFQIVSSSGATVAVGADVNVIFDTSTGTLYYDTNGGNSGGRSPIGQLTVVNGTFDFNDITVGAPLSP
jgi:hypothetical protein